MINRIIILAIVGLSIVACEKEVFPELETQNNLIVEGGYFQEIESKEGYCEINLSESINFLSEDKEKRIQDAIVQLQIEGNLLEVPHIENGVYRLENVQMEIGSNVSLRINYKENFYIAEETLADGAVLDSINIIFFEPPFGSGAGDYPAINMTDTPNVPNYYLWQLFINDTLRMVPSPGNVFRLTLSDEFWDGQSLVSYLPSDNFQVFKGDTVRYVQYGITKQYYNFLQGVYNITSSNPLLGDPPPSDIRGNVINENNNQLNALGYFSVNVYSEKTKIIE